MAIYHLHISNGSKAKGAIGAVRFEYLTRSGEFAKDRQEVEYTESGHMPAWAAEEARVFWDAADRGERKNGRVYKEVEFALPRELDAKQRVALAKEFTESLVDEHRLPYTMAVHQGGGDNPHCHVILSARGYDGFDRDERQYFKGPKKDAPELGGARKIRNIESKEWLQDVRVSWQEHANRALERALPGEAPKIDHRSYEEQGVELEPQLHLGRAASAILRDGSPLEVAEHPRIQAYLEIEQVRGLQLEIIQETKALEALERFEREMQRGHETWLKVHGLTSAPAAFQGRVVEVTQSEHGPILGIVDEERGLGARVLDPPTFGFEAQGFDIKTSPREFGLGAGQLVDVRELHGQMHVGVGLEEAQDQARMALEKSARAWCQREGLTYQEAVVGEVQACWSVPELGPVLGVRGKGEGTWAVAPQTRAWGVEDLEAVPREIDAVRVGPGTVVEAQKTWGQWVVDVDMQLAKEQAGGARMMAWGEGLLEGLKMRGYEQGTPEEAVVSDIHIHPEHGCCVEVVDVESKRAALLLEPAMYSLELKFDGENPLVMRGPEVPIEEIEVGMSATVHGDAQAQWLEVDVYGAYLEVMRHQEQQRQAKVNRDQKAREDQERRDRERETQRKQDDDRLKAARLGALAKQLGGWDDQVKETPRQDAAPQQTSQAPEAAPRREAAPVRPVGERPQQPRPDPKEKLRPSALGREAKQLVESVSEEREVVIDSFQKGMNNSFVRGLQSGLEQKRPREEGRYDRSGDDRPHLENGGEPRPSNERDPEGHQDPGTGDRDWGVGGGSRGLRGFDQGAGRDQHARPHRRDDKVQAKPELQHSAPPKGVVGESASPRGRVAPGGLGHGRTGGVLHGEERREERSRGDENQHRVGSTSEASREALERSTSTGMRSVGLGHRGGTRSGFEYDGLHVEETNRQEGPQKDVLLSRGSSQAQGREVEVDNEAELKRELQLVRVGRQVRNVRVELGRVQRMTESTPPDGQQLEVVASIKGVDTQHVVVQWTQREDMTRTQHFAVLEPTEVRDIKIVAGPDKQPEPQNQDRDAGTIEPGDKLSLHKGTLARGYHQALKDRDGMKRALERQERERQRELNPNQNKGRSK